MDDNYISCNNKIETFNNKIKDMDNKFISISNIINKIDNNFLSFKNIVKNLKYFSYIQFNFISSIYKLGDSYLNYLKKEKEKYNKLYNISPLAYFIYKESSYGYDYEIDNLTDFLKFGKECIFTGKNLFYEKDYDAEREEYDFWSEKISPF